MREQNTKSKDYKMNLMLFKKGIVLLIVLLMLILFVGCARNTKTIAVSPFCDIGASKYQEKDAEKTKKWQDKFNALYETFCERK